MKILELFLQFLKIGAFAFGGAYGAIPLIRETVLSLGWMDEAQLMNLLGISESTPGPIMVNTATVTGFDQAGIPGALIATLGVVLPSFLVMLFIPRLQKKWAGHKVIRMAMLGIQPCLAGVIAATGIHLLIQVVSPAGQNAFDWKILLVTAALAAVSLLFRKYRKKSIPPILLIIVSAVMGMLVLSEADGWVEAVYRGQTGYCKADFITEQKEADPALLTYRVIRKGDRGKEVLAIKQRLQELGYIRQSSKLTEDYNDTTVQRVKLFQKQMGLKEDGIASPEVQACLFSNRAPSCTQSLPKARSRVASGSDDSKREICGCCMGEGCECCGFRGWVYSF